MLIKKQIHFKIKITFKKNETETTWFSIFNLNSTNALKGLQKLIRQKDIPHKFCPATGIKTLNSFSSVVRQVHHSSACLGWGQSKITSVNTLYVNPRVKDRASAKPGCALSLAPTQIQTNFGKDEFVLLRLLPTNLYRPSCPESQAPNSVSVLRHAGFPLRAHSISHHSHRY